MQQLAFLPDRSAQKRLIDVALSAAILLPAAIPLALAAGLVRLSSGSPILFRQVRLGRGGVPFVIYKLRTMRHAAGGPKVTVDGGSRITREGRFLRATKLDELPQLFNVLKGEMSLVGPRPEIPEYVEKYSDRDKRIVLSVRPGLTDFASIRFRSENQLLASKADPLDHYERVIVPLKLRYCRFYVRRGRPALDIYILGLTAVSLVTDFAAAMRRRGKPPASNADPIWHSAQPLGTMRRNRRRIRSFAIKKR
jgi:lipopolysaccharide/colanic/teichoic acid biosynthesis glycosyltransferase